MRSVAQNHDKGAYFMARNRGDTVGALHTSVRTENGWTHVRYHSTDVVSFNATTIILRTGGWNTPTTRRRMNQAAQQFGLPYSVFCRDSAPYVKLADGYTVLPFGPDDAASFPRKVTL